MLCKIKMAAKTHCTYSNLAIGTLYSAQPFLSFVKRFIISKACQKEKNLDNDLFQVRKKSGNFTNGQEFGKDLKSQDLKING